MKHFGLLFCGICFFLNISVFAQQEEKQFMDFSFITTDDSVHNLSDYSSKHILLYFYNPECRECNDLKKKISKDEKINKLIEEKQLIVIALVPEVKKEYWQFFSNKIPENWVNGWKEDDDIIIKKYLKKVPTLFLLDGQTRNIINRDFDHKILIELLK